MIRRDSWFLLTDFGDGDDDDFYKGKSWTVKVSTVMLQCYLVRNPGSTMTGSIWQTGGWTNQLRGFTALVQSYLGRRLQASNCRRTWNRKAFCKTIFYERGKVHKHTPRHCLTQSIIEQIIDLDHMWAYIQEQCFSQFCTAKILSLLWNR